MSTTSRRAPRTSGRNLLENPLHLGAAISLAILTGSYLSVMFHATGIVGGTARLAVVVAATFLAAFVLAESMGERDAAKLAGGSLLVGLLVYFVATPGAGIALRAILDPVRDVLALLTGYTILAIISVDLWVTLVAPGPLFLSWYLVFRRRYVGAVAAGLPLLLLFVLTGDADPGLTLVGVLGAAGTVGLGELARRDAALAEADLVALVMAAMLVAALSITVIPSGGASPISPGGSSGNVSTESSFVLTDGQITVAGTPSLDPTVRYTIEADAPANWRVDAYDRYTGEGWVQTGEGEPFTAGSVLDDPEFAQLSVRAEIDGLTALPALWRAADVGGVDEVRRSPADGLHTPVGLDEGQTYTVTSERRNVTEAELRAAGTDYPEAIEDRYTQLPDSTPDRVGAYTADLIADADSSYEAASIIEQHLIDTNDYSLDVGPPDGDIADELLFERDAGYCVHFATTMVAMLRSQDIPARMVTGYSAGERVAEDRWVVRGMNAHAWVEMYVPGVGWVPFDPTPSNPYDSARSERLEEAREEGRENVDTDESGGEPWQDPDQGPDVPGNNTTPSENGTATLCDDPLAIERGALTPEEALLSCTTEQLEAMEHVDPDDGPDGIGPENPPEPPSPNDSITDDYPEPAPGEESDGPSLPSKDRLALGLALLVGGLAGVSRTGLPHRVQYAVGVHWQGRTRDPVGATERAWSRLETYLEETYDGRKTGESVRTYVARLEVRHDLDDRIRDVVTAYEQARYGAEAIDPERARRTVSTVDEIVGSRIPRPDWDRG